MYSKPYIHMGEQGGMSNLEFEQITTQPTW